MPQSEGNFVWLALGERTEQLAAACAAANLSVRPFAATRVRASRSPRPEANTRLLSITAAFAPARS